MAVVDHIRDHDIPHHAIEGGRFADNIQSQHIASVVGHFRQDLVGCQPQRVVDV